MVFIQTETEESILMRLGTSLYHARRKKGLSQEAVAEKLGVSRQTISKWETDETLPDIRQAKKLSVFYGLTLDELISFDLDTRALQEMIDTTSDAVTKNVDWTRVWGKKYPILTTYQTEVAVDVYAAALDGLLGQLQRDYGYDRLNALLVLKDILSKVWKDGAPVPSQEAP